MRCEFALSVFFCTGIAVSQQSAAPNLVPVDGAPSTPPTLYYASSDVTAPQLIPIALTGTAPGHCKKLSGTVVLSADIDASGQPATTYLLRAIGNDLDRLALQIGAADRFQPGTYHGAPAAAAVSIQIGLNTCIVQQVNAAGEKQAMLRLRTAPGQKIELRQPPDLSTLTSFDSFPNLHLVEADPQPSKAPLRIAAPVPIHTVEAEFSDHARRAKIQGVCLISLIVDTHGLPENPRIIRSIESSLDQNALEAISHYRFKPALRDGTTPVPVMITIEVDFRLY